MKNAFIQLLTLAASLILPGLAVFLVARRIGQHHKDGERMTYSISYPRDMDLSAIRTTTRALSGLIRPQWSLGLATMVLEIIADEDGISHYISLPPQITESVLSQLRHAIPGIRIDEAEPQYTWTRGVELKVTGSEPLRTDKPEAVVGSILASLSPLNAGEAVLVHWVFTPAGNDKNKEPMFYAVGRIGAQAGHDLRARHLVNRTLVAIRSAGAPGAYVAVRRIPRSLVKGRLGRRRAPHQEWPCLLNGIELGMLSGIPIGSPQVPNLHLGTSRHLMPSRNVLRKGFVVAQANFPGSERPLAFSPRDLTKHLHIMGPTDSGKSTVMLNLMTQQMQQGYGLVAIDPKGDLKRFACSDDMIVAHHRLRPQWRRNE